MYIAFIDESGQPGGYDKNTKTLTVGSSSFFIVSAFLIDADDILDIERKLTDIKLKYGLSKEFEAKWNMNYSKVGFNYDTYCKYKEEILNLITYYPHSVISIVMDKEKCYQKSYINDHKDMYFKAFHLLMERIFLEVRDRGEKKVLKPTLSFVDSRKTNNDNTLDKELQIAYKRAKNIGTYYYKEGFPNFSDSLVFMDSQFCAGVQLADFCAGATYKYYAENEDRFIKKLQPAFRTHDGNIKNAGIKLFP